MTIRRIFAVFACLTLAACGGGPPDSGEEAAADPVADSITRRQRDSIIGESRLPGARGVRGALDASDAAAARNATLDSLSGGR